MPVTYSRFGPITGWTWGKSTVTERSFDPDANLEALESAGARDYTHDDAFRITAIETSTSRA